MTARRWNGLWRRGAGTWEPYDPDNGRLILTITGIGAILYARKFDNRRAMMRALYWMRVRRYKTELCQHCGRPVQIVYHAPDAIWEAATGRARHPDGHAAPGILCPPCLDDLAVAAGLPFLRWTCAADDSVMYDSPPSWREERMADLLLSFRETFGNGLTAHGDPNVWADTVKAIDEAVKP